VVGNRSVAVLEQPSPGRPLGNDLRRRNIALRETRELNRGRNTRMLTRRATARKGEAGGDSGFDRACSGGENAAGPCGFAGVACRRGRSRSVSFGVAAMIRVRLHDQLAARWVAAFALLAAPCSAVTAGEPTKPNVVVILADDRDCLK
jgi:hypothetical protein